MLSIHVHEILEMISTNSKPYSIDALQNAVIEKFSENAHFHSCSIENMTSSQAVEFLVNRGKFIPQNPETSCCGGCGGS